MKVKNTTMKLLLIEDKINNTFFVSTISELKNMKNQIGFIVVTNEANDILDSSRREKKFYY